MKTVVLVGNPNVGKSLLFSRITKTGSITANYAGTTVEAQVGRFSAQGEDYEIVDGPGIYSLERFSESDKTALELVSKADILVDVLDSTNLERNLGLSLELLALRKPTILCLNLWDDTVHKGISIDEARLSSLVDLPVVATSALAGTGVSDLVSALPTARASGLSLAEGDRWEKIGEIVGKVQVLRHRHHSFLERLSDFSLHPVGGILTAAVVLVATLLVVRYLGEWLTSSVFAPLYNNYYGPFVTRAASLVPWALLRGFLVGYSADPLQSFGVLTSGVYIAFVNVFPYFFAFYFIFGFLEDFGYLPRLAVVLDKLFHHLGLHGYSSIPVMLGLGCKVPAFLSTRMLTNKREKILTITLIFMSAPCLPQTSMIIALGMHYGVGVVLAIFGILLIIAFATNYALNKIWKGDSPDFFSEIPSYRVPRLSLMAGKLWMRIKEYLGEVLPMIAVGVLVMNILDLTGFLALVTRLIEKPCNLLFGLPSGIAPIMLLGFLRKDVSIALLVPLGLSARQFITAGVFLSLYTPCVSSFFTLIKETGLRSALRIVLLVFLAATLSAIAIHFALG
jgi:ferrous iron transport protein B